MNPLDWLMITFVMLGAFYLFIGAQARDPLRTPYRSPVERPPHWQTLHAHRAQMKRIANLSIPFTIPEPRPETRPFLIRYHVLPEGSIHEVVVDGYDLSWALGAARRLGIGVDVIAEVIEPPPGKLG